MDNEAPPAPELHWKWPLTHSERIIELEDLLTRDYFKKNHENIRAAIDYHREFPADQLSSDELVDFMDGKKVDFAACYPPFWSEVKYSVYPKLNFCLPGRLNRAVLTGP